jgi:hypothetical protein
MDNGEIFLLLTTEPGVLIWHADAVTQRVVCHRWEVEKPFGGIRDADIALANVDGEGLMPCRRCRSCMSEAMRDMGLMRFVNRSQPKMRESEKPSER